MALKTATPDQLQAIIRERVLADPATEAYADQWRPLPIEMMRGHASDPNKANWQLGDITRMQYDLLVATRRAERALRQEYRLDPPVAG